jgi:phosphoribosylaminoimidazolecarboxamide formyltransferase/IMP cyclohydrolase
MNRKMKIKRGLVSVSDKEGLIPFIKGLSDMGVEFLSTGGTAKLLRENRIPVKEVSEHTGSPEILDGRVKTLHPKIHGGLLGRRDLPSHVEQMSRHGIDPIDLVVVNLYPFEQTVSRPDCAFEEAIEQMDIGGPSMLRSAAKNFKDVAVVVDPADYPRVLEDLRKNGDLSYETRLALAQKVFSHTSHYDSLIAQYLLNRMGEEEPILFPERLHLRFGKAQNLRYGENPHQRAAFYREETLPIAGRTPEPSVSTARQLHGKEMSYNNFLDANAALELVKELDGIAAVIIKHNNPCGAAKGETLADAFRKAKACDPVSAFGGVVAFNHPLDEEAAREVVGMFVEIVIAPGFEPAALAALQKKKDLRLLDVGPTVSGPPAGAAGLDFKRVVGGLLLQERDLGRIEEVRKLKTATRRKPTDEEYEALAFAWVVAKHVKSNAIVYAKSDRTIGIGAGQMSRVDSVKIAAMKAMVPVAGSVMASDAFFPFRDGIDEAAKIGVTAVIQPGGSIKDEEVTRAADEHGMAMVFTGMRHFRH